MPEKSLTLREQKDESELLFDEYDDDFKNTYYSYHLTNEDYKRISKNIISLQTEVCFKNTIFITEKYLKEFN